MTEKKVVSFFEEKNRLTPSVATPDVTTLVTPLAEIIYHAALRMVNNNYMIVCQCTAACEFGHSAN